MRVKYDIATDKARAILDEAFKRPSRTSKRQQQILNDEIQRMAERPVWPRDVGAGTRSDAVLYEKIWRAIYTGRITDEECRAIAGEMFGPKQLHHFDLVMSALARICPDCAQTAAVSV